MAPFTNPLTSEDHVTKPQEIPEYRFPYVPWIPFIGDKSSLCDHRCALCGPFCLPTCLEHCGPQSHVRYLPSGRQPSKIIDLQLSRLEVIPLQYLCQNDLCPCSEHHQAGELSFRLDRDGGTLALPPRSMQDAIEMVELRRGDWVTAMWFVERFKAMHEGCDAGITVTRYDEEKSKDNPDVDILEHEGDKMSLDGADSLSASPNGVLMPPDELGEVTDEEDWASIGAAALRQASYPLTGGSRIFNDNLYPPRPGTTGKV
ncbi:MAG: hypothetical protein L6R41_003228 [Letrouitia leprolyta]|nr:MAG: hypothetical protein L6R41_003228 [Letrouitia leprolyta]